MNKSWIVLKTARVNNSLKCNLFVNYYKYINVLNYHKYFNYHKLYRQPGIIHGIDRYRPDPHAICDDEEEKWFNDEEESIAPLEENVHSISSALLSTTPPASLPGAPSLTTSFFNPSESTDVPFLHPTTHFGAFPSFVGSPRPSIKIKPINMEQKLSVSPVSRVCN